MRELDRWFLPGEVFWQTILTRSGWIVISARVQIDGPRLALTDFDWKPLHTKFLAIGVGESLAIRTLLLLRAKQEGYTTLVVDGTRTSGRNPNRPVRYERRLN